MELEIQKVNHFKITGDGSHRNWEKAQWQELAHVGDGELEYRTRIKVLWSDIGIYFFADCEDSKLSCTKTNHYSELYLEDVLEIFLWPDEEEIVYFEYEISPLGFELPLIVPNAEGTFHGWLPFLARLNRKIFACTRVIGGEKKPQAPVKGWQAEFYIPFKLLKGLKKNPPVAGMRWRANICRIDYDKSPRTQWSWAPAVGEDFHNYQAYGSFIFTD